MSDTANLLLPLLAAAQAQKHVTVNEALVRLDALAQLRLQSATVTVPPSAAADGLCWYLPVGAVGDWAGQTGTVAIRFNGGWVFVPPQTGWRALILDEGADAIHDGTGWRRNQLAASPAGAGSAMRAAEFLHSIGSGTASTTSFFIPSNSVVFGVTGRVTEAITGTLSGWSLGVAGETDRFGSGLGLFAGAFLRGVLPAPSTEYDPVPLLLSAEGGEFATGTVRLVVHYLELSLPS